ncbi:MAG: hypothetical protein KAH32_08030, partial [Chlamydiia bacterium]|nr:hypothetical protein [Chlamydiia bacterium]
TTTLSVVDVDGDVIISSINNDFDDLTIEEGKELNVGGNATNIKKLELKVGALLVGTGVTCTDVVLSAMPTVETGGSSDNPGSFWRELGMPFSNDIKVNEVTWGTTYHGKITGEEATDAPYIYAWDATNGKWNALSGTDNLPSTVDVYLEGGEVIKFDGINLDQHNADFFMPVTPNTDPDPNIENWNFIPNPFLSNIKEVGTNLITPNTALLQGNTAAFVSVLVVDGPGAGTYKTIKVDNTGTLGKNNLSVLQGVWVQVATAGSFKISTDAQSSSLAGNLPLSKNNLDSKLPTNITFNLFNETTSEQALDSQVSFYVNDEEPTVDAGELRLYDASTLNIKSRKVASMFFNRVGHKLASYEVFRGDLESNTIVGDLSLIGKTDGDYKISISGMTIDAGYNAYLVDKQENTTHLLNTSDYSFTHVSTNEANRF